jgi:hypothetical protein
LYDSCSAIPPSWVFFRSALVPHCVGLIVVMGSVQTLSFLNAKRERHDLEKSLPTFTFLEYASTL